MKLFKIDGINRIINMDRVESIKWEDRPNSQGQYTFYVNDKNIGYFESKAEKDRVTQMIFDKFATPGCSLYVDERGYEVKADKELWN